jgi:hypothetical protein
MSSFTTRVELHKATYDDYETLHSAMQAEGFSRLIYASDGNYYHLPTAEYDRSGELTTQQVLQAAQRAAARTGRTSAILVTEAKSRTFSGLAIAKAATSR